MAHGMPREKIFAGLCDAAERPPVALPNGARLEPGTLLHTMYHLPRGGAPMQTVQDVYTRYAELTRELRTAGASAGGRKLACPMAMYYVCSREIPDSPHGQPHASSSLDGETLELGSFDSVEGLYRIVDEIDLPKLPRRASIRIFKQHIQPTPQDPNNVEGGQWVSRAPTSKRADLWTACAIAASKNTVHATEVNGVVLSCTGDGQQDTLAFYVHCQSPGTERHFHQLANDLTYGQRCFLSFIYHLHDPSLGYQQHALRTTSQQSLGAAAPHQEPSVASGTSHASGGYTYFESASQQPHTYTPQHYTYTHDPYSTNMLQVTMANSGRGGTSVYPKAPGGFGGWNVTPKPPSPPEAMMAAPWPQHMQAARAIVMEDAAYLGDRSGASSPVNPGGVTFGGRALSHPPSADAPAVQDPVPAHAQKTVARPRSMSAITPGTPPEGVEVAPAAPAAPLPQSAMPPQPVGSLVDPQAAVVDGDVITIDGESVLGDKKKKKKNKPDKHQRERLRRKRQKEAELQALLLAMEGVKCCECELHLVTHECRECPEGRNAFCTACHTLIHQVGKRKLHKDFTKFENVAQGPVTLPDDDMGEPVDDEAVRVPAAGEASDDDADAVPVLPPTVRIMAQGNGYANGNGHGHTIRTMAASFSSPISAPDARLLLEGAPSDTESQHSTRTSPVPDAADIAGAA